MPGTHVHKKGSAKHRQMHKRSSRSSNATPVPVAQSAYTTRTSSRSSLLMQGSQGLFMAALVALGCWGIAFTFVFLTQDANRFVFGAMAALMALIWSGLFAARIYKWQQR